MSSLDPSSGPEIDRTFRPKRMETPEAFEGLSAESQAGLRQFSLERMTGYGIDYADAIELRAGVLAGDPWRETATVLAERNVAAAERTDPPASDPSRISLYRRASALLRMSQALMLRDDDVRREIVVRAGDLYARAAVLSGDRERVLIPTDGAPMAGWFLPAATSEALGSVVVIGGVEGWAMDFDGVGAALARRGLNALMLDAPGQGETRILHRHHLSPTWLSAFATAIDHLEERLPGRPIGIVGHSMGGGVALAVANADIRIKACVNNGGIVKPSMARMAGETFFAKMVAFCGVEDADEAAAIWDTVEPVKPGPNTAYGLLVIQGGDDPLVSDAHARAFMEMAPVTDKRLERFSDGIHCIYNHLEDRDLLIADWMLARLGDVDPEGKPA